MNILIKLRGDGAPIPQRASLRAVGIASIGGIVTAGLLGWLAAAAGCPLVIGSFGASIVLVFCLPDAPVAQPRNIIGGHFISSLIGLIFLSLTGPCWWGMALAAGAAIALMMLTGTMHPPGGANTLIVFLTQPAWSFLIFPTLVGSVIILIVALMYNNATRPTRYPKYW